MITLTCAYDVVPTCLAPGMTVRYISHSASKTCNGPFSFYLLTGRKAKHAKKGGFDWASPGISTTCPAYRLGFGSTALHAHYRLVRLALLAQAGDSE